MCFNCIPEIYIRVLFNNQPSGIECGEVQEATPLGGEGRAGALSIQCTQGRENSVLKLINGNKGGRLLELWLARGKGKRQRGFGLVVLALRPYTTQHPMPKNCVLQGGNL